MKRKAILLACPNCGFEMAWQRGDYPFCPVCLLEILKTRVRKGDLVLGISTPPWLDRVPKMAFKPKRGGPAPKFKLTATKPCPVCLAEYSINLEEEGFNLQTSCPHEREIFIESGSIIIELIVKSGVVSDEEEAEAPDHN